MRPISISKLTIALILGAMAFSVPLAGAAPQSASERGFQLSEWASGASIGEFSPSAKPVSVVRNSNGPDLGEFLREEISGISAGAASNPTRIREYLANRWETAPDRLAGHFAERLETRLQSLPWVDNVQLSADGFGAFSASGVGILRASENGVWGFQPGARKSDQGQGGSFGLFQRNAIGDFGVAGINAFADYESVSGYGALSRWSVGADFQSAWADAQVNRYFGGSERSNGQSFAYAPNGMDAEIRVHAPGTRRVEGYAQFSKMEGQRGESDLREVAYGMTFAPFPGGALTGFQADAEMLGSNAEIRVRFDRVLDGDFSPRASGSPFAARASMLRSVKRESLNVRFARADSVAPTSSTLTLVALADGHKVTRLRPKVCGYPLSGSGYEAVNSATGACESATAGDVRMNGYPVEYRIPALEGETTGALMARVCPVDGMVFNMEAMTDSAMDRCICPESTHEWVTIGQGDDMIRHCKIKADAAANGVPALPRYNGTDPNDGTGMGMPHAPPGLTNDLQDVADRCLDGLTRPSSEAPPAWAGFTGDHYFQDGADALIQLIESRGRFSKICDTLSHMAPLSGRFRNADFNATPLHKAIVPNRIDVVKLLLLAGAEVNAANVRGSTPLDRADKWGRHEIAAILRKAGGACAMRNGPLCDN